MMSPCIRPGDLPPFHDLGEYVFQELCRDLLDAEPDIATCEVYGERGQRQDGIDLRAYCKESNGIVVGQCKCYQDFPPAEIRQASEDFLAHWDRWAHENVTGIGKIKPLFPPSHPPASAHPRPPCAR
jgi:hypothetical protein